MEENLKKQSGETIEEYLLRISPDRYRREYEWACEFAPVSVRSGLPDWKDLAKEQQLGVVRASLRHQADMNALGEQIRKGEIKTGGSPGRTREEGNT